jgi:hypothetical protein
MTIEVSKMFGWLGKRGGAKPEDYAQEFLASLTGSAAAVLQQVSDWVDERIEAGELDLKLLQMADARLEPVVAAIAADSAARRGAGGVLKLLRAYCERFARAYARLIRQLPAGHADALPAALRAAYLYSRAWRLARMAYDDPGALRQESLAHFRDVQRHGLATQRKPAYPGLAETSAAQELAVALLWETAPFDTLSLEQLEYLERFILAFANRIVLKSAPGATAPFAVLPDGRVAAPGQAEPEAALLFVGPGLLAGQLAGVAKLPDDAELPVWAGTPLPHTDLQTLKSLAQRMGAAWERKRVQRVSERHARGDSVRVTGGFHNIRRAVAYAAYVRAGGKLDAYDTKGLVISDRLRQVMVGVDKEQFNLSPVEVLAAMEGAGDSNAVESWTASDSSAQGYSLAVPGYRAWLAVGGLLAVREGDQIDWHVAIVRRLFGGGNARRVGVETLRGRPAPVGIGDEGRTENVGLAELRDAIQLAGETGHWLITPFECQPGGTYLVAGQHGRRPFKLGARNHGNADFNIYDCAPA